MPNSYLSSTLPRLVRGSRRTTPATHGNRALTESQKDSFFQGDVAPPSFPTTVLSEIGTRMYLRATKEAHEFTVNVLSQKFRRASRLMKHANTTDPPSMIWRIMTPPTPASNWIVILTPSNMLSTIHTSDGRLDLLSDLKTPSCGPL